MRATRLTLEVLGDDRGQVGAVGDVLVERVNIDGLHPAHGAKLVLLEKDA